MAASQKEHAMDQVELQLASPQSNPTRMKISKQIYPVKVEGRLLFFYPCSASFILQ